MATGLRASSRFDGRPRLLENEPPPAGEAVARAESKPVRAAGEESALSAGPRGVREAVKIADWQPLRGAMPMPGDATRSATVVGVTGHLW